MSFIVSRKNLTKALLNGGPLVLALFEYELQEHIEKYLQSKQADNDEFFFAVTEHTNDVAMLLIDEQNQIHINEHARSYLQTLWPGEVYKENMLTLIPQMAEQLAAGYLFAAGVKTQAEPLQQGNPEI